MLSAQRVNSLRQHHRKLEQLIHEEMKRPHPDDLALKQLKFRRLAVKREITRYTDPATQSLGASAALSLDALQD